MAFSSERTLEQLYRSAVAGFYARLRSNYDFLYERFGDEGINLIAEMSRSYGLKIAERAKKRVDGTDAISVARYLLRIFETVGGKEAGEIDEMTDKRVVIKATSCPLQFTNPEMCVAHTSMEKTVVEELNPQLSYRIGKSIPAGNPYCEHIIEKKGI
jgi:hypothetical protein